MVRVTKKDRYYLQNIASVLDIRDEPVVLIGGPLGPRLNLHILHRRNELVNDQVLQTDLASQLPDAVHEVLALAMDDLRDVIELVLGHAVACLHPLRLLVDLLQLFLLRAEVFLQLHPHVLFGCQVLLHGELGTAALLQLRLRLEQLLLLLHGTFHFLVTPEKLLLHVFDLFEEFLLLGLGLLLGFLLNLKFFQELFTLFFRNGSLGLKLSTLFLELLSDGFFVFFEGFLHLSHFRLVNLHDHVGTFIMLLANLTWLSLHVDLATGECSELLSQTSDLVVELADHSIFGVLIDAGLVLDVLGTGGVPQRGK